MAIVDGRADRRHPRDGERRRRDGRAPGPRRRRPTSATGRSPTCTSRARRTRSSRSPARSRTASSTPDTVFQTPGQLIIVGGTDFEDVEARTRSSMTVPTSCASRRTSARSRSRGQLGKERFDAYLRAFGFGQPTGLGFPASRPASCSPLSQYTDTSLASMPIGNGHRRHRDADARRVHDDRQRRRRRVRPGSSRPPSTPTAPATTCPPEPAQVVSPDDRRRDARRCSQASSPTAPGTKAADPGLRRRGQDRHRRKPPYDKPPYKYVASFAGFAPADDAAAGGDRRARRAAEQLSSAARWRRRCSPGSCSTRCGSSGSRRRHARRLPPDALRPPR